jgi:SAM-dependent methyltransferase
MKKSLNIAVLAVAGLLALAAPSLAQDLDWQLYKGYDVPFVPTPPEVVDEMLRLAGVKAGDILYDLGCGDGRIVIAAAKRYGVKAIGIDIDPVRIKESEDNAAKAGLAGKVRFVQKDLFESDFKDATVVTMYLLTSVNLRLRPKLLAELKPGTRLVSHSFEMGEWVPDATSLVKTSFNDERDVHFWIIPANVTGRWEWDFPGGPQRRHITLLVSQQFQALTASGAQGEWPLSVGEVSISGDRFKLRLDADVDGKMRSYLYEGTVLGDTITGKVRPADDPKAAAVAWKAARDPKTAVSIAK